MKNVTFFRDLYTRKLFVFNKGAFNYTHVSDLSFNPNHLTYFWIPIKETGIIDAYLVTNGSYIHAEHKTRAFLYEDKKQLYSIFCAGYAYKYPCPNMEVHWHYTSLEDNRVTTYETASMFFEVLAEDDPPQ